MSHVWLYRRLSRGTTPTSRVIPSNEAVYDHQADIAGMQLGRNYRAENRSKDRQIVEAQSLKTPLFVPRDRAHLEVYGQILKGGAGSTGFWATKQRSSQRRGASRFGLGQSPSWAFTFQASVANSSCEALPALQAMPTDDK